MAIEFNAIPANSCMTKAEYDAYERRNGKPPTVWSNVHELRKATHVDGQAVADLTGTMI